MLKIDFTPPEIWPYGCCSRATSFLPAAKPRRSMDDVWPPSSYDDLEIVAIRGQKSMVTYVIEVTELNFGVRCDPRVCLEATMASEAVGGCSRQYAHGYRGNQSC